MGSEGRAFSPPGENFLPAAGEWQRRWLRKTQARFHREPWFDADPGVLAAWMRTGEIQAEAMRTAPWDRKKFLAALERIREWAPPGTEADPQVY